MVLSTPALILLVINLGLLWLLMAAPVGVRTIRFRRIVHAAPSAIWEAVYPLGRNALWYPSVISSEANGEPGRVVQQFSHADRKGIPIRRIMEVDMLAGPWERGYKARVVEDSALDVSFWASYSERRMVSAAPGGAEIVVEQTDRYRGLAFMVFRYFALRRELNALETWAQTGKADNSGLFERPETQVLLAILSTLLLWPFLGLNQKGLILSSMLTVVIAFHELGHLAAYRSFGHKSVRMIFIPFLGGIAIGGRPYRTLFEVAVCALMGAGLSAFLVPVVIAVHAGLTPAHPGIANGPMMIFLLILSSFNLLNLLPMYRFDGGQVLRQVFPTRDGLMGATFAVTSAILWAGWRIGIPDEALFGGLAVMALISFTGQSGAKPREALDDMSGGERLVAGFGYYSALVIHVYGLIFAAGILYP